MIDPSDKLPVIFPGKKFVRIVARCKDQATSELNYDCRARKVVEVFSLGPVLIGTRVGKKVLFENSLS